MTDEPGINNDFFLARVKARQEEKRDNQLDELVGYSTQAPPAPASNGVRRPSPPRIPPMQVPGLNGLFGRRPETTTDKRLQNQVSADAQEMRAELDSGHEKSELDHIVDDAISSVDVLDAYRKWIRKMEPKVYDGQVESIMISCPIPGHEDSDPSAWINSAKGDGGLWHCGGCQRGGDKYDLAAVGLGYNLFQYKTDGSFRQLKLDMARDLGVDVDSHLLGPAAKAYLAEKEEHQKGDQAEPVTVPQETRERPTESPAIPQPSQPADNLDPLTKMHLGSVDDYNTRLRKYYNKGDDTQQEAPASLPIPAQIPGASPIATHDGQPKTEAEPQEVAGPEGSPNGVTSKDAPPPMVAGLGGLFGSTIAPPPAEMLEDTEQQPAVMPPGFKPLTKKAPTIGIGLMPGMGGKLFVSEPAPRMDPTDPGLVKAMLEDYGVRTPDEDDAELGSSEFSFSPLDVPLMVAEDTFLGTYCRILRASSSPNEWNFWNGVAGLSVAVGKRLGLQDTVKPVYANLYVCLLGETTAGKSVAKSFILGLIRETMPWLTNDPLNTAPRLISGVASGEKLIDKLRDELRDPAKPSSILEIKRVAGLVEYDELATVMAKSSGPASNFVPILQGLFDGYAPVESSSFTTGDKVAPDPFVTMLTSTQPSMLQRLVGREHVDNGFMNRFVFAPATEKIMAKEEMLGGDPTSVEAAGPYLKAIHEWAVENEGRQIGWDKAALALGRDWLGDVVHPNMKKNGDNKLIKRTDLIAKKLMLIFALNSRQSMVTTESVEAAMKVYPYLMDSYNILDRSLTATESSELREKILLQVGRLTVKIGKPPTYRELYDALGRSRVDGEVLVRAIKNLVEIGDLKQIQWPLPTMPQVGRKTVRYGLASDDQ